MTFRDWLAYALVAGGIGALLGRALPGDPSATFGAPSSTVSTPSASASSSDVCKHERAELASLKGQLAGCMMPNAQVLGGPDLNKASSALPNPEPEHQVPRLPSDEDRREYQKRLDTYSEAVVVQHRDGRIGVYRPEDWPADGEGMIIARKLASGKLGYYAGPDAGPRSDPSAFRPMPPPNVPPALWGLEEDGTITIEGAPASSGVQRMFGGKTETAPKESGGGRP